MLMMCWKRDGIGGRPDPQAGTLNQEPWDLQAHSRGPSTGTTNKCSRTHGCVDMDRKMTDTVMSQTAGQT